MNAINASENAEKHNYLATQLNRSYNSACTNFPFGNIGIDCGPLDYPKNGEVSLTGTEVGSTATYDCIEGYVLVGVATRQCKADGDWSGDKPHCKRKPNVLSEVLKH